MTESGIDLTVYYSNKNPIAPSFDAEIGQKSGWDFDMASGYTWKSGEQFADEKALAQHVVQAGHSLVVASGYSYPLSRMLVKLGKSAGVRVGFRSDSILMYRRGYLKSLIKKMLLPRILNQFCTAHPTGTLAKEYLKYYGVPGDRCFYYPYAVDNQLVAAIHADAMHKRGAIRAALSIPKDAFMVVGAAKFVPREDPLTLLHGFRKFVKSYPGSHLVLIGDGMQRPKIEADIVTHQIPNVHLPGYLKYTDFISHLVAGDVFVHAAVFEQWGVSVNEAMVCEVPVLAATTVGASADLIEEDVTGATFAPGDATALSKGLEKMVASSEARERIAKNAFQKVDDWGYQKSISEFRRALSAN